MASAMFPSTRSFPIIKRLWPATPFDHIDEVGIRDQDGGACVVGGSGVTELSLRSTT